MLRMHKLSVLFVLKVLSAGTGSPFLYQPIICGDPAGDYNAARDSTLLELS